MATTLSEVSIEGMRLVHFEQLLNYIKDAEASGVYWGNKHHFNKRHRELEEWVEQIIKLADHPDYVIPKRRK